MLNKPSLRVVIFCATLMLFTCAHLYLGTQQVLHTQVSTFVGVYETYYNTVLRLVFPIICTLIAVFEMQSQVSENFVASTRSRQALSRYFSMGLRKAIVRNAVYFSILGSMTVLAVNYVAPRVEPNLINPNAFGFTPTTALLEVEKQNPLGFTAAWGSLAYGLSITFWLVASSSVMSILAFAAVIITKHRVALLLPMAFYVVETAVTQLNGLPKLGLFSVMPTPASMQQFGFFEAFLPLAVLAIIGSIFITFKVRESFNTGEFS